MAQKTQEKAQEKMQEKLSDLYFTGHVIKATYGTTRFDKGEKYRITIKGDIPYEDITAYEGTRSSFVPQWFKEQEGYVNLSSVYDIPCRYGNDKFMFSDWISSDNDLTAPNSEVCIRIRQKDGAVYPVAIDILKDGEVADVWEGFDK